MSKYIIHEQNYATDIGHAVGLTIDCSGSCRLYDTTHLIRTCVAAELKQALSRFPGTLLYKVSKGGGAESEGPRKKRNRIATG